ncbi:hypothetical protein TNIN_264361 [Trichonephila inaurata madagascariensis]|uniref:Uncharacterized protein n=1 Tax=Trichonephila inaurata madagascariensis TaxID=2747483 RepID=A0A8X7CGI0_9ARAC|nr:hypothetical protein TNIN_264361 [Trichonephila inaurata madagascariensis]
MSNLVYLGNRCLPHSICRISGDRVSVSLGRHWIRRDDPCVGLTTWSTGSAVGSILERRRQRQGLAPTGKTVAMRLEARDSTTPHQPRGCTSASGVGVQRYTHTLKIRHACLLQGLRNPQRNTISDLTHCWGSKI